MCEERCLCIFLYFVYFLSLLLTGVEDLELLFMTKGYILGCIDELAQYPEYTQLLVPTAEEELQPPSKRTRQTSEVSSSKAKTAALIPKPKKDNIKGKKPPQYMQWLGKGSVTADLFNLHDMRSVMRLQTYLMDNGRWELFPTPKNGQCLFASVRRGLQLPEEFRSNHLRFQLVHFMCKNHKTAFEVVEGPVKIQYGQTRLSKEEYTRKNLDGTITASEEENYSLPGPFTFQSFLKHMLEPSSWGDQTTILLLSMMWQLPITILYGEELTQVPIRHDKMIDDVELLLIFVGRSHYLGTCKYNLFSLILCEEPFMCVRTGFLPCEGRSVCARNSFCGHFFVTLCEKRLNCVRDGFCHVRNVPPVRGTVLPCWLHVVILGKKSLVPAEDEEAVEEVFEGLTCKKPKCLGNFTLSGDSPENYTDKLSFLDQSRAFPKQSYPQGSDFDTNGGKLPSGASFATSNPGPSTSTAGVLSAPVPEVDPATIQLNKDLIDWHFRIVQMCKRVGVADVCATFKKSRLENYIDGLSKDDLSCKLCKKTFKVTQRLRDHIRLKHLKKTAHYCEPCDKYYSDAGSLKKHNAEHHDEEGTEWGCNSCDMRFPTQAKLRKHLPVHQGKTYSCQFCGVTNWTHPQGVKDHERTCTQNPDYKPGDKANKSYCRICGKGYLQHRSLLRHLREKHDNAPEFK